MHSRTLQGAMLITLAMALFVQNDVATKLLTERFSEIQVMIVRGIIGAGALLVPLLAARVRLVSVQLLRPGVLLRAIFDAGASLAFVYALADLSLAMITAIMMLAPILSAFAGAVLFREALTVRLAVSMALGFAGVVVFAQPDGGGIGRAMLLAIFATLLLSARDLVTRRTASDIPSGFVALVTTLAVPAMLLPFAGRHGFAPMALPDVFLLLWAGIFAALGNWLLISAMRMATLAELAPFRYTAIPISVAAGLVVWGDPMTLETIAGCALIATGGVLAIGRR